MFEVSRWNDCHHSSGDNSNDDDSDTDDNGNDYKSWKVLWETDCHHIIIVVGIILSNDDSHTDDYDNQWLWWWIMISIIMKWLSSYSSCYRNDDVLGAVAWPPVW